ncbi:hypothetical protein [Spartinivicinus poritis]|uniref:Uncharacterized protein n=1 Tax=Spartinivicinus poritis TaxID=2994640 RepID=A0ABT5UH61_9GAMM|nr:hypothetical protein [Spartinivicinus sp. A2-2]MDE1465698.1 hypothetical protein [Spartinivicinus sp. A2-2]
MKVSYSKNITEKHPNPDGRRAEFQFALTDYQPKKGNSSAGVKHSHSENAVRLAWWNADGTFDPISSAELPEWAVKDLIKLCAQKDFINIEDINELTIEFKKSIERQLKEKT